MLNKTPPVSDLMMDQQIFTWHYFNLKSLPQHWASLKPVSIILVRLIKRDLKPNM